VAQIVNGCGQATVPLRRFISIIVRYVEAVVSNNTIRLGSEALPLHEQSGYGRIQNKSLLLSPEEALYLAGRDKITLKGYTFSSALAAFSEKSGFLRRFLVYRDIRERGYVLTTGPQDFRVFRRGERPGTGQSLYLMRVISEREQISFKKIAAEVTAAKNMRKSFLLAAVDDEGEITYYEVKLQDPRETENLLTLPPVRGSWIGTAVVTTGEPNTAFDEAWIGTPLNTEHRMLSAVEALYLLKTGVLTIIDSPELNTETDTAEQTDPDELMQAEDKELAEKERVYADLRERGMVPRTAYKFGHHFRVYRGTKKHSEMLVHALQESSSKPMSVISRSVRLAHSVRKKMFFACVHTNTIEYIEFSRIKM